MGGYGYGNLGAGCCCGGEALEPIACDACATGFAPACFKVEISGVTKGIPTTPNGEITNLNQTFYLYSRDGNCYWNCVQGAVFGSAYEFSASLRIYYDGANYWLTVATRGRYAGGQDIGGGVHNPSVVFYKSWASPPDCLNFNEESLTADESTYTSEELSAATCKVTAINCTCILGPSWSETKIYPPPSDTEYGGTTCWCTNCRACRVENNNIYGFRVVVSGLANDTCSGSVLNGTYDFEYWPWNNTTDTPATDNSCQARRIPLSFTCNCGFTGVVWTARLQLTGPTTGAGVTMRFELYGEEGAFPFNFAGALRWDLSLSAIAEFANCDVNGADMGSPTLAGICAPGDYAGATATITALKAA